MHVKFFPICTIFMALLFVSGTTGCRSNGGDWYNPKSYTWTNPFARNTEQAPLFSANEAKQPSIGAQPNIDTIQGGYTDRSGYVDTTGVAVSTTPPGHWGIQSPTGVPASPSQHAGFSVAPSATPTHYSVDDAERFMGSQNVAQSPLQHTPQGAFPMGQPTSTTPYGATDYLPTGFHVPNAHPVSNPYGGNTFNTPAPMDNPVGMGQDTMGQNMMGQGNHALYGVPPYGEPQQDSYAIPSGMHQIPQQPMQPAGFPQTMGTDQQQVSPLEGNPAAGNHPQGNARFPQYQPPQHPSTVPPMGMNGSGLF